MSGGKSLEQLQRRMMSGQPPPAPGENSGNSGPNQQPPPHSGQPHQQGQPGLPGHPPQGQISPQQINPNPRPGKSSAALMATQAREQATHQQQAQPPPSAQMPTGGRPKGKDFAAMAMHKPPAPAPAPPAPVQAPPDPGGPMAARPKGKDFGAMASRMGAQQPAQRPQPQQVQQTALVPAPAPIQRVAVNRPADVDAQRLRAQQMQAAARAAAGLPPLDKYTATSVTTVPPPITTTKAQARAGQPAYEPPQQQQPQQQQYHQQAHPTQQYPPHVQQQQHQLPTQQQPQRKQASKSLDHPRPSTAKTLKASKPTPQPTPPEARVSLTSKQPTLVGPKLQDLLKQVDPNYTLNEEAEEQVLQIADDFLDKVTRQAAKLAQHRGSKIMDVQDIQLALAKHWGISVPGLGMPTLRPLKPGKATLTAKPSAKRKNVSGGSSSHKKAATSTAASTSN